LELLMTTHPPTPLPQDPNELQEIIASLQRANVQKDQRILELEQELALFKRYLFGRRSEKMADDPQQGTLFQGDQVDEATERGDDSADDEDIEHHLVRRQRRSRHRGRRPLPDHYPRQVYEIHPREEELTCCDCGERKVVFGQDVTEELDVIPVQYFVNRYIRFKYCCRACQSQVSIGSLPHRLLDKGICSAGLIAHILTQKYADHLPLYRQQQIFKRHGADLSRSTLSEWVSHAASLLSPVVTSMKSSVLASRKVHTDDTPITVLDRSHPGGSRRGYMWVYIGDQDDVVFDFTDSHKRDGPEGFLKGYHGYLQADAFSGYNRIYTDGQVLEVACWAHARRKFYDAQAVHGHDAKRLVHLVNRLYALERRARAHGVPAERLLHWRQHFGRRRLARLRLALDQCSASVLPKSPLGQAITYALKNWKALNRYTEAAYLSIDNNHSERQIKQLVIGRKNWLFAGSEGGAESAAILFSLVVSCKLHDVDPFAYFRDVLMRVDTHPAALVHQLTPREWKTRFGAMKPEAPDEQAA
jgi:transposase